MNKKDQMTVENFVSTGMELETLYVCFPVFSKEEITEIYNNYRDNEVPLNSNSTGMSINCSWGKVVKMDIRKQDWKLFREKVPEWQELYMEKLLTQYIALLSDESSYASKRFWELDEKIKKDKRTPGVQLQLDKSEMEIDTAHLIIDGAITLDDLSDFSKEFQDTVNNLIERFN